MPGDRLSGTPGKVMTGNNSPCLCGSIYETPSKVSPNFETENTAEDVLSYKWCQDRGWNVVYYCFTWLYLRWLHLFSWLSEASGNTSYMGIVSHRQVETRPHHVAAKRGVPLEFTASSKHPNRHSGSLSQWNSLLMIFQPCNENRCSQDHSDSKNGK